MELWRCPECGSLDTANTGCTNHMRTLSKSKPPSGRVVQRKRFVIPTPEALARVKQKLDDAFEKTEYGDDFEAEVSEARDLLANLLSEGEK